MVAVLHRLFVYVWNKAQVPFEWRDSIIIPIPKKAMQHSVIIIVVSAFLVYQGNYLVVLCKLG
jgi:hypothetical protein